MGTWGFEPMENDSALDFIDEFLEVESPAGVIRSALKALNKDDKRQMDQVVRVLVWTPTSLTREERDLLERLREVESEPPEPDTEEPGFWERVKRAFTA